MLLILIQSQKQFAQCYEEGSGTCDTAPTTISGTEEWDGSYICINSDLTITGTGSLTITGLSSIEISANKEIKVNNGGVLIINGGSVLYAGGDMWKRINVKSGGTVIIDNAIIADAIIGIYAENGTSESVYQVSDALFCNNETGIYMDAITTSTLSSYITGSYFTAPSLKAPKLGQEGDYGIVINDVYPDDYFIVGDGSIFGANKNVFTELNIGIRQYNSKVQVQNNEITNSIGTLSTMPETKSQIGICATGDVENGSAAELWVGAAVPASGLNNSLQNCRTAILASTQIKTYIMGNEITGNYDSGSSEYIMKRAIDLQNDLKDIEINANRITNFNNYGIYIKDQHTVDNLITANQINISGTFYNPLTPAAIYVFETMTSSTQNLEISNNLISNVKSAILVSRIEDVLIGENEISFILPATATGTGYGIRLENCNGAEIYTNTITGICSGSCGTKVRPIYIESCDDFLAEGNAVFDGSLGFYIHQPSPGGNLLCNEIHDCTIGIGLEDLDVDGIGDIGSSSIASDNSWYPSSTANRVYCFGTGTGTDGASLVGDWFYRSSPSEFDIPVSLTTYDVLGSSTDFNPSPTSYSSDPCYTIYRLAAETAESAFEEMTLLYYETALSYTDVSLASQNQYHTYINFWNDANSVDGLSDILADGLLDLYNAIAESNIPQFLAIKDSVSNKANTWALEKNNAIIPVNDIENYLQLTNGIYLNNLDSNSIFQLADETYSDLEFIANLPGGVYGEGVYNARGMLGLVIEPDFEMEIFEERLVQKNEIYVYPNPANDILYFSDFFENKEYTAFIYNSSGKELLKSVDNNGRYINISILSEGIYFIKFIFKESIYTFPITVIK